MDAKTLNILATDIQTGIPNDPFSCMLANTFNRELPQYKPWAIYPHARAAQSYTTDVIVNFPPCIGELAIDFDDGKPVEPQSFTVEMNLSCPK